MQEGHEFGRGSGRMLCSELCPPPHSCVETLIPDVSVFGDRAQLSDKHLTQTEIKFK